MAKLQDQSYAENNVELDIAISKSEIGDYLRLDFILQAGSRLPIIKFTSDCQEPYEAKTFIEEIEHFLDGSSSAVDFTPVEEPDFNIRISKEGNDSYRTLCVLDSGGKGLRSGSGLAIEMTVKKQELVLFSSQLKQEYGKVL